MHARRTSRDTHDGVHTPGGYPCKTILCCSAPLPGARVTCLRMAKEKSPRDRPPRKHALRPWAAKLDAQPSKCEFAPARDRLRTAGSFADRMSAKPACPAHGFGYFPRKERSSLAAGERNRFKGGSIFLVIPEYSRHPCRSRRDIRNPASASFNTLREKRWIPAFAAMTPAGVDRSFPQRINGLVTAGEQTRCSRRPTP